MGPSAGFRAGILGWGDGMEKARAFGGERGQRRTSYNLQSFDTYYSVKYKA
jgi:hypothetical protein